MKKIREISKLPARGRNPMRDWSRTTEQSFVDSYKKAPYNNFQKRLFSFSGQQKRAFANRVVHSTIANNLNS